MNIMNYSEMSDEMKEQALTPLMESPNMMSMFSKSFVHYVFSNIEVTREEFKEDPTRDPESLEIKFHLGGEYPQIDPVSYIVVQSFFKVCVDNMWDKYYESLMASGFLEKEHFDVLVNKLRF